MIIKNHESKLYLIHKIYPELTFSERKIADYILKDPLEIIDVTIEALAEKCNTSIATVSRFTKKLKMENFYHLKLSIAKEFVNPTHSKKDIKFDSSIAQAYSQLAINNAEVLVKSIEYLDEENMEKIVKLLGSGSNIHIFAMGTSIGLAFEAWNKFIRLGMRCSFNLDFHSQLLQAVALREGDIALILSHSGINKDILDLIEIVKETQAVSIGITNYSKTPFEKSVDHCLSFINPYVHGEFDKFTSRIPLIMLIETINKSLEAKLGEGKFNNAHTNLFKKRSI